ncbi:hypothetical protein [Pedobacter cryotolerans]|uniref:Secreted protein n=1 Tax=Pedobacter cryotolerans TaxID=2571270 RepID=A0A4U1C6T6_9SPHI|nr:hypothetical protein [Pedobacter cryotolerans]TKC00052.1 hypothetical protein FA045_11475 [Pedobacter cryotolerans]
MKKLTLFLFASFFSFGVAVATTGNTGEIIDDGAVPCSSSECPGSGTLCCKDAKTGDPFYKR